VTELETAPAQINSANTTLRRSGAAAYLASHAGVHGLDWRRALTLVYG
jgi:hypothetical protein